MALLLDDAAGRLVTVASRGYPASGLGWECPLGQGVIGVAAQQGVPIRVGHLGADTGYLAAVREGFRRAGAPLPDPTDVRYPGLEAPLSQIALPLRWAGRTRAVLFAESAEPHAWGYEEEDALALVAAQAAALLHVAEIEDGARPALHHAPPLAPPPCPEDGGPLRVRRFAADDTIFLGHDYLIKGVAGAVLWTLLRQHRDEGREEFTNRELRLDPALRLPEMAENLETRLLLLQRRLEERGGAIRIARTGRGRFRLCVSAPLDLVEVEGATARAPVPAR